MLHVSRLSIVLVTIAVAINVLVSDGSMTRDRVTRKSEERHKFISFDADDETIEGENPATLNFGAILLLGIIAIIGTVIGTLRAPGASMDSSGLTSLFKTEADTSMDSANWVWTSLKDSMVHENGILNDCAQKFICLTTAEAIERRRRGGNTQLDSLIEGVSRRVHLGDVKLGGSVSKAIDRAFGGGCSGHFTSCSVKIHPLQKYLI